MHTSVNENKAYFIKALNEVLSQKMEEELAGCEENAKTSVRHKIIMKQIAKGKCFDSADKTSVIKKAILIAVIAAMLALTSCALAIIYRAEIAGFIEHVYEEYILVSSDDDDETEYPTKLEKIYEFTYIPEGYELKYKSVKKFVALWDYLNLNGERLKIRQQWIGQTEFKVDINKGYSKAYTVNEIEIYCREEDFNAYICQIGDYMIQIHYEGEHPETELPKIVAGIQ